MDSVVTAVVDGVVTALVGLVGVLVGSFLGAYASSRASIRSQGQAAARLTADGLEPWTKAVKILKEREPGYPRDETYDVYVAMDLSAVRPFLAMDWWENNRAGLVAVASEQQWDALTAAARACRGLLMLLSDIGDAGKEVFMKRAEILSGRASDSASKPEASESIESSRSAGSDPQMADLDDAAAKMDSELTKIDITKIDREFKEDLRELRATVALLDHRLQMVRSVYSNVISAGPKFDNAALVCRSLEEATRGSFGLVGAIRRLAKRNSA